MAGRLVLVLVAASSAVACTLLAFDLITVSIPVYRGMLFAYYPDPARPGHLKGVTVTGPQLALQSAAVLILLVATIRMFCLLAKIKVPEQIEPDDQSLNAPRP
jgi:hypothetical protein